MNKEEKILKNLKEVNDPESGKSICPPYHLTVPFCPDVFPFYIGRKIKKKGKRDVKNI